MYNNANAEQLMEKWAPVLEHGDGIQDAHKRAVTAQLLENQAVALQEERTVLSETPITTGSNATPGAGAGNAGFSADATDAGPVAGYDPTMGKIDKIRKKRRNRIQPR